MAHGMEVGLGPGHIVLAGDPAPLPKKGQSPSIFGPLQEAVLRFEFHQNRLSGFRNLPSTIAMDIGFYNSLYYRRPMSRDSRNC